MSDLENRIAEIRRRYPRRVVNSYTTDTYFDGSIGPSRIVYEYDDTAERLIAALIDEERRRLDEKNSVVRAIFGD